MSESMYASFQRAGTSQPYAKNVYVQISKMEAKEASDWAGADPNFTARMYTKHLPTQDVTLVQQGDLVTDQRVIDPKTQALRKYRIISDPDVKTLMMEIEFIATRMRGT